MEINGEVETETKLLPLRSLHQLAVDFFPESGMVGCNMKNRIYYEAHDENGRLVRIRSELVKEGNGVVGGMFDGEEGRGVTPAVVVSEGEKLALRVVAPPEFEGKLFPLPV